VTTNLTELVEKAKAGNKQAFMELIDTMKLQLYKTALVRLRNEQDALDAVQEALYKAFSNIKNLRENQFFKTWLIRILLNECYNIEQYKQKVIPLDNSQFNTDQHNENDSIESMDIRNLTKKLETIYREVIDLRYNHDLKFEDIALVLDIPVGTVKSRLNRAHILLRERLGTNYSKKEVSS
jgi:RNA polymerase sigma-70 factor (ECF subfamily)